MDVCGDFMWFMRQGRLWERGEEITPRINRLIASSASQLSEQENRESQMRNQRPFFLILAMPLISHVTVGMIVTVLCLSSFICPRRLKTKQKNTPLPSIVKLTCNNSC